MPNKITAVEYYYCTVEDQPGESYKLLSLLAEVGVNLFAFTAVPSGLLNTQFTLFPEDSNKLITEAKKASLVIHGPVPALLVQGTDELGALTEIHKKLYDYGVNVVSSSAVTDGKGGFGYIIYIRAEQFNTAKASLGI
jgi:hypothetical protein